jgi:hypothetical protein
MAQGHRGSLDLECWRSWRQGTLIAAHAATPGSTEKPAGRPACFLLSAALPRHGGRPPHHERIIPMIHSDDHQSQVSFPPAIYYLLFDNAAPPAPWELAVAHVLIFERYYELEPIRNILAHARTQGTVEDCTLLGNDDDRAAVESFLPLAPSSSWNEHRDRWTITA